MSLATLDHVLIRARDLDETRDFFVNVLGFTVGKRPPFKFDGYWLYLGDKPVVHLAKATVDTELSDYFGEDNQTGDGEGNSAVDHVAFHGTGIDEFANRIEAHEIACVRRNVPLTDLHQFFLHDPNGVKVEINFDAKELSEADREKYEN